MRSFFIVKDIPLNSQVTISKRLISENHQYLYQIRSQDIRLSFPPKNNIISPKAISKIETKFKCKKNKFYSFRLLSYINILSMMLRIDSNYVIVGFQISLSFTLFSYETLFIQSKIDLIFALRQNIKNKITVIFHVFVSFLVLNIKFLKCNISLF